MTCLLFARYMDSTLLIVSLKCVWRHRCDQINVVAIERPMTSSPDSSSRCYVNEFTFVSDCTVHFPDVDRACRHGTAEGMGMNTDLRPDENSP